jgi:two-component system chemotaxis sensor kinase CheA
MTPSNSELDMDDVLHDFLTESNENLARLDSEVVALERSPGDTELLGSIFRTIHTIKGTCGFLGLSRLETVAHAAESVLGLLREGALAVTTAAITDVLGAVDVIRGILAGLEATGAEPAGEDGALIARLERWLVPGQAAPAEAPRAAAAPEPEHRQEVATVAALAESGDPAASGGASVAPEDEALRGEARTSVAESSLRVNVTILDRLMNMVGELVLTRNQLIQLTQAQEDSVFFAPVQQINRVTTDLQEAVMKTRMQPVGTAWGKLPRLVRDLSQATGRKIELEMHGAETELDRQICQAIQDPLTHMIRNSADHGIETPETRRRAGKPERGTIRLNAYHEGGHVIIEISDDGAGIDAGAVRRKAVDRGLVTAEAAAAMPEAQALRFVFEPGFSTAAKVTSVSGRGVGMDVVRSNIERIGGTVDLSSRPGEGTTVRVKIPLTLAIISALVVGAGNASFAIPQIGVVELVRVTEENGALIEVVHGAEFYRLRDTLLPLVHLDRMLALPAAAAEREYSIVVCQVGRSRFGLVVAEVFDTQEIVVKPVGRLVKHLNVYAGCTILGDGRVIMILDTTGIAVRAGVGTMEEQVNRGRDEQVVDARSGDLKQTLLLFDTGQRALQAVPLALVARLEEVPVDRIEFADGRHLVQYRGTLLPLLPADAGVEIGARDPQPVVVFGDGRRAMGLAVREIRDIVESAVRLETTASRPGVLGAAVVAGRATELLDTQYYLRQAFADWFEATDVAGEGARRRVLLVDDSPFFIELLTPILRAAGYDVATSADGRDALARLERGETFDVVLSDIDMPHLDGCELARRVRAAPAFAAMRLIALTGRTTPGERQRGLEAGFDNYLVKFDREAVVAALADALTPSEVAA